MKTKIVKWGNFLGIQLPKDILASANLKLNDKVQIKINSDSNIVISKARPSIKELCSNYQGDYKFEEVDWGQPVGKEVW